MHSSLPAKAVHKIYRLQLAINEMTKQVKNDPSKQSALEEFQRALKEWSLYGTQKKDGR